MKKTISFQRAQHFVNLVTRQSNQELDSTRKIWCKVMQLYERSFEIQSVLARLFCKSRYRKAKTSFLWLQSRSLRVNNNTNISGLIEA